MRRSAAPSQQHSAKRAKFMVPYKPAEPPVAHLSQAGKISLSAASEFETDREASRGMTVSGSTCDTDTDRVNTVSSPKATQKIQQIFSPPSFLSRKTDSISGSGTGQYHTSQHRRSLPASGTANRNETRRDTPGVDNVKSDDNCCESESDSKHVAADDDRAAETITHQTHSSVLETSPQNPAHKSVENAIESDSVEAGDNDARLPLKPFNAARKFQSPLMSRSWQVKESGQTADHKRNHDGGTGKVAYSAASNHSIAVKVVSGNSGAVDGTECAVKCSYFSVVWCKLSKKKHKKWEGDAVLVTQGRRVTLYDMDGKEIGKGSGYKSAELESLAEDETLVVGGKEIQVMSKLSEEQFKSGKCFAGAGSVKDDNVPTPHKPTAGQFKSFTNPVLAQKGDTNMESAVSRVQNVAPKFDPSAPDALVMPRPTAAHQWQNNKQQTPVVDVVVDPHLCYHLRPHQCEGVTFLYECVTGLRNYGGAGAILADDMGLGKTLQCIALVWTLLKQGMYGGKPPVKRVLVVTPGSLVKNWAAEFRKWLGTERLQVFVAAGDSRVEDYVKTAVYPVLIISYEMFVRGYEVVKSVPFDLVVCDEGHRLKNAAIKTNSLISSLDTRRRVVLSGTPIQNDLQEFFAVVDFCNPGVLGSSAAFRRVYEDPILQSRQPGATKDIVDLGEERAAELSRLTRMFVLRRTQEVNNKYLPPKVELVLFCQPSALQINIYHEILRTSVVRSCLMGRGSGAGKGAGAPHLLAIAALKQLCNHPKLIAPKVFKASEALTEDGDAVDISDGDSLFTGLADKYHTELSAAGVSCGDSGKLAALNVILANVFGHCPQEKVVLVSNHTKTLDLLQQFCSDCGYSCVRLDGHTPTAQRQQIVTRFNSSYGQEKIFLLSSKAGGVGLNLIGASRLILYDIDWNPANDLQAMARVWRDGQKRQVYIYRLLTTGSLEEKVYQRQISKQGLSGAVMDLKASDFQFSQEDLK
ncbi:DNA repair and recombination protein RAD54B-like isoform X2 [Littorina saxatilis]